ncbi:MULTISPECIES: hypothetical protein [unclassified Providencia]|uniref:hypothetical protein n=1 Tax=unclassified Providencia TaxID=2633465 RepID=UPI000E8A97AA|nr:hypothetical protein [Providencia sp.]MBP6082288.1 hypothetical protein [Providencia sp.]HBO23801.1 hypothetical protein [Providencia sp.]
MTNIQLLLLATNNIKQNINLSHSQESYVYQYYHANIASKYSSVKSFLENFIQQTAHTLESNPELSQQRLKIYNEIENYLNAAEARFLKRQSLLQNTNK